MKERIKKLVGIGEKIRWTGIVATSATALWIILAVNYFHLNGVAILSPNALGDFFAGVFAPVAFFWLVLGYFLQQKELKQNTEALHLQRDEFENLVKAMNSELALKITSARPLLNFEDAIEKNNNVIVPFTNNKASVTNVAFLNNYSLEDKKTENKTTHFVGIPSTGKINTIDSGMLGKLVFVNYTLKEVLNEDVKHTFLYTDSNMHVWTQPYVGAGTTLHMMEGPRITSQPGMPEAPIKPETCDFERVEKE